MTAPNTTSKCHTCENLHAKKVDLLTVDYCGEGYYTPPKDCPCYIEKPEIHEIPLTGKMLETLQPPEKQAIGYYNELEYRVEVDGKEVYTAGNSPLDSQGYVSVADGVGLNTMRDYCNQTTQAIASEHDATFVGIEYLET